MLRSSVLPSGRSAGGSLPEGKTDPISDSSKSRVGPDRPSGRLSRPPLRAGDPGPRVVIVVIVVIVPRHRSRPGKKNPRLRPPSDLSEGEIFNSHAGGSLQLSPTITTITTPGLEPYRLTLERPPQVSGVSETPKTFPESKTLHFSHTLYAAECPPFGYPLLPASERRNLPAVIRPEEPATPEVRWLQIDAALRRLWDAAKRAEIWDWVTEAQTRYAVDEIEIYGRDRDIRRRTPLMDRFVPAFGPGCPTEDPLWLVLRHLRPVGGGPYLSPWEPYWRDIRDGPGPARSGDDRRCRGRA